jgi:hypothetical protein
VTKFVLGCDRNLVRVLVVFNFPLYLFNFVNPSGLGMLSLSLSLSLFVLDLIPQLTLIFKTLITSYSIQIKSY